MESSNAIFLPLEFVNVIENPVELPQIPVELLKNPVELLENPVELF